MTERMSIEEFRKQGLDKGATIRTSAVADSPELRQAIGEIKRLKAMLKLVRQLLEDGHELRLEHLFHSTRKWRFDLALPDHQIALEIEGGIWTQGRHVRGSGYENDMEKYNAAQEIGWRVARATWPHVISGEALQLLRRMVVEETDGG